MREGNAILGELGRLQSAVSHHEALVELLAGEPAAAEAQLRAGYEKLEEMGEHTLIATTAAMLAQAVSPRAGRRRRRASAIAADAADDDVPTQAMWRGVRARLLAAEGRAEAAAALARDAVALAERTDFPTVHADARLDLAAVLEGAAAEAAARRRWRRARALRAERQCRLGRAGPSAARRGAGRRIDGGGRCSSRSSTSRRYLMGGQCDGLRSVADETDEHGKVVPRRNTVRFHFLIVQGEHVLRGESASRADRW